MENIEILNIPIAAANIGTAADQVEAWIEQGVQTYVTVTGVHGIMESQHDPEIMRIHQQAGMCVPDGMPTVFLGQLAGHEGMRRVYGPDLMLEIMQRSVEKGHRHFFYGGKEGVPELLSERLTEKFPGLCIVGTLSPPFRPMTDDEERDLERTMDRLAPDIIWVGLSTPKQERWMAEHVGKLNAKVMIGVGAAFDFHAGLLRQAPNWMQKISMEWFFRLCVEPRRLYKRYLRIVPGFIILVLGQMLRSRGFAS